jgi:hypothetical protein
VPQVRLLLAEHAVDGRVAVRDVDAGELVVAVVLPEAAERRVDRGGRVAALGDPTQRLVRGVRVVEVDVERGAGVERVALSVQRVARVLDHAERVPREERHVVEPRATTI